jgi:hypothetical protein
MKGVGVCGNAVPPTQFFCEPKTALLKSLSLKKKEEKKKKKKGGREGGRKESPVQEKSKHRFGTTEDVTLTHYTETQSNHSKHIAQHLSDQYGNGEGAHPKSWEKEKDTREAC